MAIPEADLHAIPADLATAAGCDALVKAAPACDILVNNVGVYGPQDFFDISNSEWPRFFEINVMSGVRLSRAYMPAMLKRDWGRVVRITRPSSVIQWMATTEEVANMVIYAVSPQASATTAALRVDGGIVDTIA